MKLEEAIKKREEAREGFSGAQAMSYEVAKQKQDATKALYPEYNEKLAANNIWHALSCLCGTASREAKTLFNLYATKIYDEDGHWDETQIDDEYAESMVKGIEDKLREVENEARWARGKIEDELWSKEFEPRLASYSNTLKELSDKESFLMQEYNRLDREAEQAEDNPINDWNLLKQTLKNADSTCESPTISMEGPDIVIYTNFRAQATICIDRNTWVLKDPDDQLYLYDFGLEDEEIAMPILRKIEECLGKAFPELEFSTYVECHNVTADSDKTKQDEYEEDYFDGECLVDGYMDCTITITKKEEK